MEAPDDLIVTGPDFEQKDPQTFLVTPAGRPQTTLAQALADASGSVTVIRVQGGPFLIENTITTTGTVENSVGSLAAGGVLFGANADPIEASDPLTNAQLLIGQPSGNAVPRDVGGDVTMDNLGDFALVASGATAGTYGDATHVGRFTIDAAGRVLGASDVAITGIPASAMNVGTTTIGGGTSGRVLYDNAGTLGELTTTGSGAVVLATAPTLTLLNATGLPLATGVTGRLPFANLATVAATSLLGNGTGAGADAGNIAIGSGLSLSVAGTLTASGSGGSVTSVVAQGGPFLTNGTITGAGTITNSITSLTASALLLGAGSSPVSALGSLGTTTTVLHGNVAGAPTFGAVSLSADVAGLLPFANLATLAASSLFGNGGTAAGSMAAIPLGTNLSFTSGTLNAAGGGSGSVTSVVAGTGLSGGTITTTGTISLPSQPYTAVAYVPGTLTASQVMLFTKVSAAITFPANFGASTSGGSSGAASLINSTGTVAVLISQCPAASDPTSGGNFTNVGTVTFAAGHAGTFTSTGGTAAAFAAGDFLKILAPGTADATLSDVTITLVGNR